MLGFLIYNKKSYIYKMITSIEKFKQHQELIAEAKKNKQSLNDTIRIRLEKNQKMKSAVL